MTEKKFPPPGQLPDTPEAKTAFDTACNELIDASATICKGLPVADQVGALLSVAIDIANNSGERERCVYLLRTVATQIEGLDQQAPPGRPLN